MLFYLIFVVGVSGSGADGDCRLDPHPSVEFHCILPGYAEGTRVCSDYEPAGTAVRPECRKPNYYTSSPLALMHCFDGDWDYVARCKPECGRVTPDGKELVVGGVGVRRGQIPWHAGIYNKTTQQQICGGSLISEKVILSAAHCFWRGQEQLPASWFAVAVGKLFRSWNDNRDAAQKSDVKLIHIPERYQGAGSNFQDDIAVVILTEEIRFETFIRPVCLNFDYRFEQQQLNSEAMGKVAGWGLTAANGKPSPVLQVVDLPYVDVGTCIRNSRPDYRELITSDKICAGTLQPTTALCEGDSGGGLVFEEIVRGVERYYLRGVVSSAPTSYDGDKCNTDAYTSFTSTTKHEHFIKKFWTKSGEFKCHDGGYISAVSHCDGTKDCADGSDETVAACSEKSCSSYLFQCAYGACVDRGATCNRVPDCADGSDETDEVCSERSALDIIEPKPGSCLLPPYPEHGSYESNIPGSKPGEGYERVILTNVTCERGYDVLESEYEQFYCYNGTWTEPIPKCAQMCLLDPSPSVEYKCLDSYTDDDFRVCDEYEPNGTVVSPQCRKPNYYSKNSLPYMRCLDGYWDNVAKCTPECGTVTPGLPQVGGRRSAMKGELPWHVGIYTNIYEYYTMTCGGSLIRNDIVLSAAHCFYDSVDKKQLPASDYVVAAGKLHMLWNDTEHDDDALISDVIEIHIPPRFHGVETHFQDDIAVLKLKTAFEYTRYIRPVCLDFDVYSERLQLRAGNRGKVAGLQRRSEEGHTFPVPVLQVVELPYVEIAKCIANSPKSFLEFTTSDKICAGTIEPDKALCIGDSGGALVFPAEDSAGVVRYYARGIASVVPHSGKDSCTSYTTFTQIKKHEDFIKHFVKDL